MSYSGGHSPCPSPLPRPGGVDDVTTQQIADKADIGTGTLFLYAKTKGELLLLVQNSHYVEALERGRADAEAIPDVLDAVLAIVRPIVECNRGRADRAWPGSRQAVSASQRPVESPLTSCFCAT